MNDDVRVLAKAVESAQLALARHFEPAGALSSEQTIKELLDVLNDRRLVAALNRLKGDVERDTD